MKRIILATVALIGMSGAALAEPQKMTAAEMEQVSGGLFNVAILGINYNAQQNNSTTTQLSAANATSTAVSIGLLSLGSPAIAAGQAQSVNTSVTNQSNVN